MIDPSAQWMNSTHLERELLLEIELPRRWAAEEQRTLTQPWYTQVAKWLTQAVLRSVPGLRVGRKGPSTPAGCPTCAYCCPSQ